MIILSYIFDFETKNLNLDPTKFKLINKHISNDLKKGFS